MEYQAARLLQEISDAVAVVRLADGLVVDANRALLTMTGYRVDELVGRSSHDLVIWATVAGHLETVAGLRLLGSVGEAPAGFLTRAGELRMGGLSVLVVHLEGRRHGICVLRGDRDPTAAERRAVARLELGRILRGAGPWLRQAEAAVRAIGGCLRWDLGAVWRADPEARILRRAHAWHAPGCPRELAPAGGRATVRAGEGLLGRVLLSGEAAWVEDARRDGSVAGWFAVPVADRGGLRGVLEFGSSEVRRRDQEALDVVTRFASWLGRVAGGRPIGPAGGTALGLEPPPDQVLLRELAHGVGRLNRLLEGVLAADRPGPEPAGPAPAGLTLKALSERTGVPAATLRTWERRYGFLEPARSSGGYRLYGEDDVGKLLEARRLLEQGVRIGAALAAVRRRPPEGG